MEDKQSELGLGCWAFGDSYWSAGRSGKDQKNYRRLIQSAYDHGVRHFDTAQVYGGGMSEQLLGQQLRPRRQEIEIADKTLHRPADTVERGIIKSLRRLGTDYIDLFYLHWPRPGEDLRPHMEALEKARAKGLIRRIGLSNFSPEQIAPLLEAGRVDYCQFGYNLLWRGPERRLVPFCRTHDIRVVTYGSLAQGLLAHPSVQLAERREAGRRPLLLYRRNIFPQVVFTVYQLELLASAHGISLAQLALAWNLSRRWIDVVLFGVRDRLQLEESLEARKVLLSEELLAEVDRISSGLIDSFPSDENIFGHRPGQHNEEEV